MKKFLFYGSALLLLPAVAAALILILIIGRLCKHFPKEFHYENGN